VLPLAGFNWFWPPLTTIPAISINSVVLKDRGDANAPALAMRLARSALLPSGSAAAVGCSPGTRR